MNFNGWWLIADLLAYFWSREHVEKFMKETEDQFWDSLLTYIHDSIVSLHIFTSRIFAFTNANIWLMGLERSNWGNCNVEFPKVLRRILKIVDLTHYVRGGGVWSRVLQEFAYWQAGPLYRYGFYGHVHYYHRFYVFLITTWSGGQLFLDFTLPNTLLLSIFSVGSFLILSIPFLLQLFAVDILTVIRIIVHSW